jgi:hypothetical protein
VRMVCGPTRVMEYLKIQLDNPLGNEGSIFRYGIEHSSLVVGIGRSRA